MPSKLILAMERNRGWRLIAIVSLAIVLAVEVIVTAMDILLTGSVTPDYLLTGLVAACIVAPLSLSFVEHVLNALAQSQRTALESHTRFAETRLEMASEAAQMVFWELDFSTGELRYDDDKLSCLNAARYDDGHSIDGWLRHIHPDDHAGFMQAFQRTLQAQDVEFNYEYRLESITGDWTWVQSRGRVVQRTAAGEPLLAAGGSLNIQSRKTTESALLEVRERLQSIFNDNPYLMLISRVADGVITEVNDTFVRYSGYSRAEAIGNTTLGLGLWTHAEDRQRMTEALSRQGYCNNLETEFIVKDGSRIIGALEAVITHLNGVPHILATVRDTSARKHAEDRLQQSEALLRTTLESTDEGILMIGQDGRILSFNARFLELWHIPQELADSGNDELLIAHVLDQLVDPAAFVSLVQKLYASDDEARDTLYFKDQRVFARFTRALALSHENGRIWCFKDITATARIQQQLREANDNLEMTLKAIPDLLFEISREGEYLNIFANDETLLAAQRADLLGHTVQEMLPPPAAETVMAAIRAAETHGYSHGQIILLDLPSGPSWFELSTAVKPLPDGTNHFIMLSRDISARKQAENALRASEKHAQSLSTLLRLVGDNVPDMIWAKDLDKRFMFANKAICEQLLSASDTEEPLGKDDMFFAQRERSRHPDNPQWHTFGELCQDSDMLTLQRGTASRFDEYGNVQGKFLFLDVHKAPLVNELGEVIGVVGSARDVTAQKEIEERLRLASLVLQNSSEALLITDADNRIVDINPAFTHLTGYTRDEVIGKNPSILQSGKQSAAFYREMWQQIDETGRWQGEIWNRRKDGEIYAEWLTINTLHHADGSVHRHVALFSDITEKKRNEELIWTHANFDQLTQLPNRRMFYDRLSQDMKKAHRTHQRLALLYLDLDRFKEINDTLGHDFGDALLIAAAHRIASCVRESDTVSRLGGDEFTIILDGLEDPGCVERIADAILQKLAEPFTLGDEVSYVSASLGITLYPDDAANQEELLRNADQAMYVAKNAGRNCFRYFTSTMQESAQYRLHLLNDLRGALTEQQFHLYYQPIVEMQTGRIHKAEALLRWFHPKRGLIGPAEFIPLAEESGLIIEIGDWVLSQATRQAQIWRDRFGADFQITINRSPLQIQSKPDRQRWQEQLQTAGLSGQNIVIEITEGLLLDTSIQVASELLAFRDAGIQVAIDDFGTGYSSLSYLKKLHIDYIKIDQSFVCNLAAGPNDIALAEAIVVMAHKLGLKVVAEGVETTEQRDLLLGMGCDYAQGYLYARPVPAAEFEQLMG
ncbi:EAL domain-containing protein [Ferriphaselus sp. R-1]|uniref:EAL domain-containing protein n=1 Tax=Ferriphaselus sp. R-1 TaxID=1485544 RepID=UPI000691DF48|nr:EAL domain-containing protein [Ferriphaselus sp. R-1]